MRTISLKMPDDIYKKVEKYRKSISKNRSSYVMEAVVEYTKKLEREELEREMREDAKKTAEESQKFRQEMVEWDAGLIKDWPENDWPEYNTTEFLQKLSKKG